MRIAHVITRMIVGGAQENTLLNCRDLLRLFADDVMLITGPALGPEGDLLEQYQGHGVPVTVIPSMRRAIQPLRDWSSLRTLKTELRRFRPDVVHTHSAKGGFLGRLAAWSVGVPAIVHTVHGAPFHRFQSPWARILFQHCERFAARRCHALVSVADAMTELMIDANIAPRGKFQTVYSGMEIEPFLRADEHRAEVRSRLGFSEQHFVIGKIARLFHLKGHEYVLQAARQVIRQYPQVRFLFVGDGLLRDALEKEIQQWGLENHFRFTGLVPPQEIPNWIGAMDALVHCSLREGLARALPQALLAGKPVVSFDIDGAREVCRTGVTGFLVAPQDLDGLTAALQTLVSDRDLGRRMGAAGRAECETRFGHEQMTCQLRAIYERLLADGSAATTATDALSSPG